MRLLVVVSGLSIHIEGIVTPTEYHIEVHCPTLGQRLVELINHMLRQPIVYFNMVTIMLLSRKKLNSEVS